MIPAVEALKHELHDQPKSPLRHHQVKEHEEELARVDSLAGGMDQDGRQRSWMPGDRGAAFQRSQRIRKVLREQAPKPLEPDRRDRVVKLATDVIEGVIRPSMLTEAEMRRNPAGAVGQFMRREGSKPVKDAILTVKRALLAVEPDNDDPDYVNMDRFRSTGAVPGAPSTFMAEAQLPGQFAFGSKAAANWPADMPAQGTAKSALAQVRAAESKEPTRAERKAATASKFTEAQRKAFGERMKAAREAKKAQAEGEGHAGH